MDTPDPEIDIDAAVQDALDHAPSEMPPHAAEEPQKGPSAKEQAAMEERNAAARLAQMKAAGEEPVVRSAPITEVDEDLGSVASKGMDYLHQKMREHANKPKPVYVPPPLTEGMAIRIREEQEAGARAVARHAAQQAARPQPLRDQRDGFTTPVYRPDDVVPDPILPAGASAAGTKKFSADA